MTPSISNPKSPHMVKLSPNGRVGCDNNCPNYRAYFICAYSVAVAEQTGSLDRFVKWHRKGKRGTNLTALANIGMPASSGRKTTATKRKGSVSNLRRSQDIPFNITSRFSAAICPKPARPVPAFGTFCVRSLKFLDGKVSVCYGCRQTLKHQGQILPDPENLVIISVARISYRKDGVLCMSSELTNVYYHLNPNCVVQKNAFFLSGLVQIPDDLKPFLQQSHVTALAEKLNMEINM